MCRVIGEVPSPRWQRVFVRRTSKWTARLLNMSEAQRKCFVMFQAVPGECQVTLRHCINAYTSSWHMLMAYVATIQSPAEHQVHAGCFCEEDSSINKRTLSCSLRWHLKVLTSVLSYCWSRVPGGAETLRHYLLFTSMAKRELAISYDKSCVMWLLGWLRKTHCVPAVADVFKT